MNNLLWLRKGLTVALQKLLTLCNDCPCDNDIAGFPGWEDPNNRYMFYEYRDWDCCLLDQSIHVSEGGGEVDGHVTFEWTSRTSCKVVESTGYYANEYPVGSEFSLSGGYPSPFKITSTIISDTKRLSAIRDRYCCNADGQRIYAIMWGKVDEEEFE